ncbi:hypothetical protein GWK47_025340 [Chionoecetes opilio]|uniref:CASP-like protein n=1 Tax=Chionoecetes opilio TaxID=41210 RepID=A0A8J8WDU4_CHIOP|nr:hypothetical protein GWK47_025340 [Chionoecetes opilio]
MRLVVVVAAAVAAAAAVAGAAETHSYTTQSTVVKFNYNNIFLLLALKAIAVVVALALSKGVGYGRAATEGDGLPWVGRDDVTFLTAFILSDDLHGHQCVSLAACLHPTLARELATAAVFLSPWEGGWLGQVQKARHHLEEGVHTNSLEAATCQQHYSCPQLPYL